MNFSRNSKAKGYQTHEAYGYLITVNSNKPWRSMADEEKLKFKRFIERVFKGRPLRQLFNYKAWRTELRPDHTGRNRRHSWIDGSSIPIIPKKGDVLKLTSNINFEVGGKKGLLHAHIFVTVGANKYDDLTICFDLDKFREVWYSSFLYKGHINVTRSKDEGLLFELYSKKSEKLQFPPN